MTNECMSILIVSVVVAIVCVCVCVRGEVCTYEYR